MSHYSKYSSSGDSRRHSSRRESPPRHRSSRRSRSISPGPSRRSPKPDEVPEQFGRIEGRLEPDDNLNILQRMKTSYANSPLASLYECITEKKKVKIWTRNFKEVRGILTGYLVAFDKHWNLILRDVDEVFLKPKKCKTPFLRDVEANENLPDMPTKVPRQKKGQAAAAEGEVEKPEKTPAEAPEGSGNGEKKEKRKRKKRSKNTSEKRQIDKLFIRGDNIVMICPLDEEMEADEEEEEEDDNRQAG